jgi:hypothetical protein
MLFNILVPYQLPVEMRFQNPPKMMHQVVQALFPGPFLLVANFAIHFLWFHEKSVTNGVKTGGVIKCCFSCTTSKLDNEKNEGLKEFTAHY